MTLSQLFHQATAALAPLGLEARPVASMLVAHQAGLQHFSPLLQGSQALAWTQQAASDWDALLAQVLAGVPVQQVLGYTYFLDQKIVVNSHVLIPRPETEELALHAMALCQQLQAQQVLDLCTGSGAIVAAMASRYPAHYQACDVSPQALQVAQRNVQALPNPVQLFAMDVLQPNYTGPMLDVLVSNPPYVRHSEAASMSDRVLKHEPHLALFVPNEEPLVFYRAIAAFARQHLRPGGGIAVEINEALGAETLALFADEGYAGHLLPDVHGKDRFIIAQA